ncbi:MAG: adenylate/guanylate cyclase domain-containing protein [Chromatiales bacterium]|nr:adenylate/guanylate cyclase domain-containing protein [Chromatiales bacterium]
MPADLQATLITSLKKKIHRSQREVTILFSDMVDSTRYWHNRGNVEGRLLVDRHNRLLFPVIRQFRGRIVKTLGDAIMAMFNSPHDALNAAIAIQQVLQLERERDDGFDLHLRVGLHVGEAIVEHSDVYGDVVNVAARIVSEAAGDEILISGRLARRLNRGQFRFSKHGGFIPKGKQRRMALHLCHWQGHEDLASRLKLTPFVPLALRQRLELSVYLFGIIGGLYYLHLNVLRYLLSDHESLALLFLNPAEQLLHYWYLTAPVLLAITYLLWCGLGLNTIPTRTLKAIKGGACGLLLLVLLHSLTMAISAALPTSIAHPLYESSHLFVEIRSEGAALRATPHPQAEILMQLDRGTLLLQSDIKKEGATIWNKVLVAEGEYGWVERIRPAAMGVAEERISWAEKFTLRRLDLLLLLLSLPATLWGYRSFHVTPH